MSDKDYIKDKFSEKLGNYQPTVRPEIWANVSAGISGAAPAATGLSLLSKAIIGISAVAVTAVGVVIYTNSSEVEETNTLNTTQTEVSIGDTEVKEDLSASPEPEVIVTTNTEEIQSDVYSNDNEVINTTSERIGSPVIEDSINNTIASNKSENVNTVNSTNTSIAENNTVVNTTETSSTVNNSSSETQESTEESNTESTNTATTTLEETFVEPMLFNFISPNHDGDNDELFVAISEDISEFNVVVLDAQNKVVFTSSDPNFRWNGVDLNGTPVEEGNYLYFITYKQPNGQFNKQSSMLTIRR